MGRQTKKFQKPSRYKHFRPQKIKSQSVTNPTKNPLKKKTLKTQTSNRKAKP
jgi:hypothetical protein